MDEHKCLYILSTWQEVSVSTIHKLIRRFGSAEALCQAEPDLLREMSGLSEEQIRAFIYRRNPIHAGKNYETMTEQGIRFVTEDQKDWPAYYSEIYDPPLGIYVKGRLPERGSINIAIVGARNCSPYGRETAKLLARGLAAAGVGVISGMARGVDSAAHWGALEGGGRTYAVLGCGVDCCYPRENWDLYSEIAGNGAIISEYPPGTDPLRWHFPARNRLIAGLSEGVLVTEARQRSGSLITIDLALNMGKDIYAVPGNIDRPLSEGCNHLIKDGAKAVTCADDILEEYGLRARVAAGAAAALNADEELVYSKLSLIPHSIEEIQAAAPLPLTHIMNILMKLEIKNLVSRVGKSQYVLRF